MRRSCRWSRCASTASSLPIVVGVAGWPWVCASSGTSRRSDAMVATASTSACAVGSQTCSTAPLTISAYDRLLMSSLVQQKWMSSASPLSRLRGRDLRQPALEEVLDGLDVVLGDALDLAHLGHLLGPEVLDDLTQRVLLVVGEGPDARHDLARVVRWISHSTSTRTRSRFSAGSERCSTRGATALR